MGAEGRGRVRGSGRGGEQGADGRGAGNTCQYVGSKVVVMGICFL